MNLLPEKIYSLINQSLFWWQYTPADERETQLFHKAYERFFWTLVMFVFITLSIMELYLAKVVPIPPLDGMQFMRMIQIYLLSIVLLSYAAASSVFYDQNITLKKQRHFGKYMLPLIIFDAIILASIIFFHK